MVARRTAIRRPIRCTQFGRADRPDDEIVDRGEDRAEERLIRVVRQDRQHGRAARVLREREQHTRALGALLAHHNHDRVVLASMEAVGTKVAPRSRSHWKAPSAWVAGSGDVQSS